MKKKASTLLIQAVVCLGILSVPFLYNNCSPLHAPGSGELASLALFGAGACDSILESGFANYHSVLVNKCSTCHSSGGTGNGQFADSNIDIALTSFMGKGETKVYEFASNPSHKPPYTGDETKGMLDTIRDGFLASQTEYNSCLSDSGGGGGMPPGSTGLPSQSQFTINRAIPANTNNMTITYNLATDLVNGTGFTGATFSVTVTSFATAGGITGYDISAPTLRAGNVATYVKNIGFVVNGTAQAAAFQNVDRWVGQGTNRNLQSGSVRVVTSTAANTNLSIGFEALREDVLMNFTPRTYTQLTTNGGVLVARCANCHSGANPDANISLGANDYTILSLSGIVVPYSLTASQLWDSVNSGRMPPAGPLNNAELDAIKGWILDGAPR